jgi:hypothetical protein
MLEIWQYYPYSEPHTSSCGKYQLPTMVVWVQSQLRSWICGGQRKVVGSISDEVTRFFNWPHPSSRNMGLQSTQPLTEWIPGIFLGLKDSRRVRQTTSPPPVKQLSRKFGSLNVSTIWPPQPVTGMALSFFTRMTLGQVFFQYFGFPC